MPVRQERSRQIGTPKYREYAGDILPSGRHPRSLIDDLLDIEAGSIEAERTRFDAALPRAARPRSSSGPGWVSRSARR